MESRLLAVLAVLVLIFHRGKAALNDSKPAKNGPEIRAPWNSTYTDALKRSILAGYDKFARPSHHSVSTNVTFGLAVYHVELDDTNAVMTIHGWIKMSWNDDKLQWNASDYGGLHNLHVADHEIWQPDVVQYNSASGNTMDQYGNTHCIVSSTGGVLWVPPARLTAFCHLDLTRWPQDEHVCYFTFGSWTYDGIQVNLLAGSVYGDDETVNSDYYIDNTEWELLKVTFERQEKMYACCEDAPYVQVDYAVRVRRRGGVRAAVLRAQAAAAVLLALLSHALPAAPAAAAPRALLAAAPPALLALALFYLGHRLPSTHYSPDIVSLYTGSLYLVLVSAVTSVAVLNMARGRRALPWPLKKALGCRAARLLGAPSLHTSHPENDSTCEELQAAGGGAAGEGGPPRAPPPSRAWFSLATFLDRAVGLLLLAAFVLLVILYGC